MNRPNGFDQVRAMREGAQELPPPSGTGDGWPGEPSGGDAGEGPAEQLEGRLPEGCPVTPLGVNGEVCYYLDQLGQLRAIKAKDHSRLNLQNLFGVRSELLYEYWPRKTQDKTTQEWITTGWKPELAAEALMAAAARKGAWNPQEKVRGRGAWLGEAGELILHCGDQLLIVPAERPKGKAAPWRTAAPGEVDGYVYPTAPPSLKPAREPQPGFDGGGPGQALLELYGKWSVSRTDVDPTLLLGWQAAGFLGGALPWRVLMWVTGGYGTGKSTLQDAIKWTYGDGGLLQTADPTAAGVRQILRHSSMPVAIDEAEAEEDNRTINKLVKLARDAATGALAVRGGSDHEASTFTVRSGFMFSSILIPPLLPQDRSRMAVIELGRLQAGGDKPNIAPKRMAELGRRVLRRLVDGWPRWADTVGAYRAMLAEIGYSARGQDVFGTLLAAADLVLFDHPPHADSLEGWRDKMAGVAAAETEAISDDADACLSHLLTTVVEAAKDRQREAVGWWIAQAAGQTVADPLAGGNPLDAYSPEPGDRRRANAVLAGHGVKVLEKDIGDGKGKRLWLAVANQHAGLARIFDRTQWGARPGADGVWKQSLGRLAADPRQLNVQVWWGKNVRSTLVDVDLCLSGADGAPAADRGGGEVPI